MVPREHIVWSHDSTLPDSKTAHCLVTRQHIAWVQDSTLFGSKTAHCFVPSKHIVWLQDGTLYGFEIPKCAFFIKYGMNGCAMAPHGLILSQDGATASKMVFIRVWSIFYPILGAF